MPTNRAATTDPNYLLAEKFFKSRKYSEALDQYIKALYRLDDDADIFYRSGLCCLKLKDFNKASVYFNKCLGVEPQHPRALMACAYTDLFLNREGHAIYKYTKLLNINKYPRKVKKILDELRTAKSAAMVLKRGMNYFLPGWPFGSPIRTIHLLILPVFALLLFLVNYFSLDDAANIGGLWEEYDYVDQEITDMSAPAEDLMSVYLFEDMDPESQKITSRQIVKAFNDVKEHINARRINEAIIAANRIIYSDVNNLIKEKFGILLKYVPKPHLESFRHSTGLKEMFSSPIYKGIYVRYLGIVSDVRRGGDDVVLGFAILEEDNIIHTAEVIIHDGTHAGIVSGEKYFLLGQYKGFDRRKKKMILKGLALKKFLN